MVLFDGLEVAVNGGKAEEGVRSPNVPFIVFGILPACEATATKLLWYKYLGVLILLKWNLQ